MTHKQIKSSPYKKNQWVNHLAEKKEDLYTCKACGTVWVYVFKLERREDSENVYFDPVVMCDGCGLTGPLEERCNKGVK